MNNLNNFQKEKYNSSKKELNVEPGKLNLSDKTKTNLINKE